MNLEDFYQQITEAREACELAGVDPSNVNVSGVIQPSWPLRKSITNVGFMWNDDERSPWLSLAVDGDDSYTTEEAFHADLNSNLEAPTECPGCGWTLTDEGCVNPDCFE